MAFNPPGAIRRTASFLFAETPVLRHVLLAGLVEAAATIAHLSPAVHGLLAAIDLLAVRLWRRRR